MGKATVSTNDDLHNNAAAHRRDGHDLKSWGTSPHQAKKVNAILNCHHDLENANRRATVHQFLDSPRMAADPGKKVVDISRAVGSGEIKSLCIIHTSPALTMPDADAVRDAIKGCDFVVLSDITGATGTMRLDHVLLHATAWEEKDGTVTNSDRTIPLRRPVQPAPGAARPDWQILAQVGQRMGWHGDLDYACPARSSAITPPSWASRASWGVISTFRKRPN